MAVKENLTQKADIAVKAREVDFVTRFTRNWDSLRDIIGIMRPIAKAPGTKLTSYEASLTLANGDVAEGEEIPYSKATVTPKAYDELTLKKYAKAVSLEAVNEYGATVAIQKTDEAFLNELQGNVLTDFYSFLGTGTLTGYAGTFQAAIAKAIGAVTDKFKKIHRDSTNVVVFVNTLDYYDYLGTANLSVQTAEGITYVKNFLGANTIIITSDIEQGKVIATPVENLVLYYVDPSNSDFAQLGLVYTVSGDTNLIGFHANGDYTHAVGESFALMGMKLWAEYLDGIAVETIGSAPSGAKKAS